MHGFAWNCMHFALASLTCLIFHHKISFSALISVDLLDLYSYFKFYTDLLDLFVFACMCKYSHGYALIVWVCMDLHGFSWVCMDSYVCKWIHMNSHGFVLVCSGVF